MNQKGRVRPTSQRLRIPQAPAARTSSESPDSTETKPLTQLIRTKQRPIMVATATFAVALLLLASCARTTAHKAIPRTTLPPPTTAAPPPPPTAPLTGLLVSAVNNRPALSIKVDNSPPALPQTGLDNADLVTDELVEGGLTRLMATYQSQDAPLVGPIRSARPVDAALLRELGGGIFAYSGAAAGEIAPVKADSTATLVSAEGGVAAFHQVEGRRAPYATYASTADLYAAGTQAGAAAVPPKPLFSYSTTSPAAPPATHAVLPMSSQSSAAWDWDPASHQYLRSQNGAPDVIAGGSRISTPNVVVLSVAVGPTGIFDTAGNEDPLDIATGSGPCWILRDGKVIAGTWQRPSITDTVRLVDSSGAVITLQPGRTWMELLPRPGTPGLS